MIGTLGQFVREIRDKLAGTGDPVPVSIQGTDVVINAEIDNEVEIKNDDGNPIPVSDAGGSLTVDGPLTDAELRATAVPVSGTVNVLTGLEIPEHDYIDLSYTGSNLTGVVYKTGGSGGTTVATLTLAYDGNDNLTPSPRAEPWESSSTHLQATLT
jgi:hypothetical protein